MKGNTRDPHVTRDDLLDESFCEVDFDSQFASPVVDVTTTALPSLYKCLIEAIECKERTVQKQYTVKSTRKASPRINETLCFPVLNLQSLFSSSVSTLLEECSFPQFFSA